MEDINRYYDNLFPTVRISCDIALIQIGQEFHISVNSLTITSIESLSQGIGFRLSYPTAVLKRVSIKLCSFLICKKSVKMSLNLTQTSLNHKTKHIREEKSGIDTCGLRGDYTSWRFFLIRTDQPTYRQDQLDKSSQDLLSAQKDLCPYATQQSSR